MNIFILIILLIIIASIYIILIKKNIIEPLVNYDVDINTTPINIMIDESDKYKKIFSNIPFIQYNAVQTTDTLYITDAYTYSQNKNNRKVITVLDDQKTFLLIKKQDTYNYETLDQMIIHKKVIGYPTELHKNLFEIICKANELDISAIKMKQTDSLDDPEIHVLIFFDSLNNKANLTQNNIDFISYDGYNIHLLKFYIPYCKIKSLPLNVSFQNYKDNYPVKTCMTIDMLLIANKNMNNPSIYKYFDKFYLIPESNYMTQYFEFFDISIDKLQQANNKKLNTNLQILEQFALQESDLPIVYAKHDLNGYLMNNKFYYNSTHIDGIPLVSGMTIILDKQWNEIENGKYITSKENPLIFNKIVKPDANTKLNGECLNNPDAKSQLLCPTIWDQRCIKNEDCPFYQKNTNYPNYFGGCESGFCQMPLGIKRTFYRTYDPDSKPICHNGPCDPNKPDYAFELDQYQRRTVV
jgi:hypothetical protein